MSGIVCVNGCLMRVIMLKLNYRDVGDNKIGVVDNAGFRFTIAIPSRKRPYQVVKNPLFALANVFVYEDEYDDYARVFRQYGKTPGALVAHNKVGLGNIRNFMLDSVGDLADDWQLQFDDDFMAMMYLMTAKTATKYKKPQMILDIACGTGYMAKQLPTSIFGWAQTPIPQERHSYAPFKLRGWVMAASMGVIGDIRFDPNLRISVDIDISLQALARDKVILQDLRYYGLCDERGGRTGADPGGLAGTRTDKLVSETVAYLQSKWGHDVISRRGKKRGSGFRIRVNIP